MPTGRARQTLVLDTRAIGERIRAARLTRGLTLQQLAQTSRLRHSQVHRLEHGTILTPALNDILALCLVLDLDLAEATGYPRGRCAHDVPDDPSFRGLLAEFAVAFSNAPSDIRSVITATLRACVELYGPEGEVTVRPARRRTRGNIRA